MADAKFLDFNGLKHFWQKIKENLAGKKVTNGGEIFNNYDNNFAPGGGSHAEGYLTMAYGTSSHIEGAGVIIPCNISISSSSINIDNVQGFDLNDILTVDAECVCAKDGNIYYDITWSNIQTNRASGSYKKIINPDGSMGDLKDGIYYHTTIGPCSHVEGSYNISYGVGSHVEGNFNVAYKDFEHAEGVYNKSYDSNASNERNIHSIGIGDESLHKNAQEIKFNGDYYVYGIGGYDGTNPSSSDTLQDVINSYTRITEEEINNLTK